MTEMHNEMSSPTPPPRLSRIIGGAGVGSGGSSTLPPPLCGEGITPIPMTSIDGGRATGTTAEGDDVSGEPANCVEDTKTERLLSAALCRVAVKASNKQQDCLSQIESQIVMLAVPVHTRQGKDANKG